MCEVFTIISGIAAGVSAIAGAANASSNAAAGHAAQNQAERNSILARAAAGDAVERGEQAVGALKKDAGHVRGQQAQEFADAGIVTTTGTAADVQKATAEDARLAELTLRNNAMREAWGFKNQAEELVEQGKQAKAEGEARAVGGYLQTGGNLLSDVTSTYSTYRKFGLKKR